jgi:TolA-binding protein
MAETQFRELLSRYPTHDKAAGGLLKVGLSQYGEGKVDQAQQTLETVVAQYPGSDAARTAQDRAVDPPGQADPLIRRTIRSL